jgi:hypothetical protein
LSNYNRDEGQTSFRESEKENSRNFTKKFKVVSTLHENKRRD